MKEAASEEGRTGIVRGGRGGIGGRGEALCNEGRKALMTKANRQKRERARSGKAQGADMKCKKRREKERYEDAGCDRAMRWGEALVL